MKLKSIYRFVAILAVVFGIFFNYGFQIIRVCNPVTTNSIDVYFIPESDTCDQFIEYRIYGRYDIDSAFRALDTFNNPLQSNYTHFPGSQLINEDWEYFIEAEYLCGIDSQISITDSVAIDREQPPIFSFDSVSVVNGNVVLGWQPNDAEDVKGYLIFNGRVGQSQFVDSVLGKFSTIYTDVDVGNPEEGPESYRISAFDSCEQRSPFSDIIHTTMHLEVSQDSCEGRVTLNWSEYEGWAAGNYRVVFSEDNGATFKLLTELPGSQTSFSIDSLKGAIDYQFFVRAVRESDESITSSSNIVEIKNKLTVNPQWVYINKVTVDKEEIIVEWDIDRQSDLTEFIIERGNSLGGVSEYRRFTYTGGTSFSITDDAVNVNEETYFYHIEAINQCEQNVEESNSSSNILLEVQSRRGENELSWNPYSGWGGDVETYEIYRTNNPEDLAAAQMVATVNGNITNYNDAPPQSEGSENGLCYFVIAREGDGNDLGFQEESRSNIACIYEDPVIYVPNAFVPDGENNLFKPEGLFIDYNNSSMLIYNRWGQKIFETDEVGKGWNGISEQGELAPEGLYIYILKMRGRNGKMETFKGQVHLLRNEQ